MPESAEQILMRNMDARVSPDGAERFPTGTFTPEGRELFRNSDGSHSSEISVTFPLPDGRWINAPSLYGGVTVSEDEARDIILKSGGKDPETGRVLPTFASQEEAVAAARARSPTLGPAPNQILR